MKLPDFFGFLQTANIEKEISSLVNQKVSASRREKFLRIACRNVIVQSYAQYKYFSQMRVEKAKGCDIHSEKCRIKYKLCWDLSLNDKSYKHLVE